MPGPGKGVDRGARDTTRARRMFQRLAENFAGLGEGNGVEYDEDTGTLTVLDFKMLDGGEGQTKFFPSRTSGTGTADVSEAFVWSWMGL